MSTKLSYPLSFLVFFLTAELLHAQLQFEQVIPLPPAPQIITDFVGVTEGSIAFADVDGDDDPDVLITGVDPGGVRSTKLYDNDGNGNYTEITGTPFEGVQNGSIAFADVDGDGDQDVLITGQSSSFERIAKYYENDGSGNFTEVSDTPFDGVRDSSIAFADVDGDGDEDVLITGVNSFFDHIAKLYINDGSGGFTEASGTPFDGVMLGSIAIEDIDGDGDQDVLITGINDSSEYIAKLYVNDGNGSFTEVPETPFDGVRDGSVAIGDVDGDGYPDVLITGRNTSDQCIAKLYTNDASGSFTEVAGTPFQGVRDGSIAFSDVDGDGDKDVLITGNAGQISTPTQHTTNFYINDGSGGFTEVVDTPFEDLVKSSIAFEDVDGDGDSDLLITGGAPILGKIAKLFINDGSGGFLGVTGSDFEPVDASSIATTDVDGDGDQDLLITGDLGLNESTANLYSNDGNGNYTEVTGSPFEGVQHGSIAFADVDGDGDQDVLITGTNSSLLTPNPQVLIAKLYTNDGSGNFTEVTGTPFEELYFSSIAFADVDGDGAPDVLITGRNSSNDQIAKLYTNDGSGDFTEVIGTPFEGVQYGSIAFADVDGDGDQDLLITGRISDISSELPIAKLYTNDGSGSFTEVTETVFEGVRNGSIAFSDVDGDGDMDILISGRLTNIGPAQYSAKLYINDGSGDFTEDTGTPFDGVHFSSIAFADVDGDGDSDVLITGGINSEQAITQLYINNGSATFIEFIGTGFDDVMNGSINFADVDGDGDQDVFLTGSLIPYNVPITRLYRNISTPPFADSTGGTVNWYETCGVRSGMVSLYKPGTDYLLGTIETEVSPDGEFELGELPVQNYDLYLKVEGFLQKAIFDVDVTGEGTTLDFGSLTPGELSGDDSITVPDFSAFSTAYGASIGDASYNVLADFNCDGAVNISDYSQFSSIYGSTGDSAE